MDKNFIANENWNYYNVFFFFVTEFYVITTSTYSPGNITDVANIQIGLFDKC